MSRLWFMLLVVCLLSCASRRDYTFVAQLEKDRISIKTDTLKFVIPKTITSVQASRSAGSLHDFYSEGDYWWPDPIDANAPYVRKDGLTNPDNFVQHRELLLEFAQVTAVLTCAYLNTKDIQFAEQAINHMRAWFVNEKTAMNPSLNYAQAIYGLETGRGIGIIDTVHLVEVALAFDKLRAAGVVSRTDQAGIELWFSKYNDWLQTSDFGKAERNNGNNHSTCWALQVSAFAKASQENQTLQEMKLFYKNVLLPEQMDSNGSFPKELNRTKPYGYSLFNLEAMTALVQILSTQDDNLYSFETDGKSIRKGLSYLYPYVLDKSKWNLPKDILYDNQWPVAQSFLLFGSFAYKNESYLQTYKSLNRNFNHVEVTRNMPVKQVQLWF